MNSVFDLSVENLMMTVETLSGQLWWMKAAWYSDTHLIPCIPSAEKEGDEWHRWGSVTAQHTICRGSEKREEKEEKGQTAGGRRVGTGDGSGGMTFAFSSLIIVDQVFMLNVIEY